jgi:hypothetical protein
VVGKEVCGAKSGERERSNWSCINMLGPSMYSYRLVADSDSRLTAAILSK